MSRFTDYAFRSSVLKLDDSEGILKYFKLFSRVEYCKIYNLPMPLEYHPEFDDNLFEYFQAFYPSEWEECRKIFNSDKSRQYRLRVKIRFLLLHFNCTFVTLTFNDFILDKTSESTRRQYVSRFLNTLDCPYIANIDFGDDTDREHYHAIVGCRLSSSQLSLWRNSFGLIFVRRIRRSFVSSLRLGKYVSKLANHAIKETCKRGALLFSRKHKLPSLIGEYEKFVTLYLAKGYFLCMDTPQIPPKPIQQKVRLTPMRLKQSFATRQFIKYCAQCGSLIADAVDNQYGYAVEKTVNGKIIYVYFCRDCIKKYKIRTVSPYYPRN